jgi:hypothetical protein
MEGRCVRPRIAACEIRRRHLGDKRGEQPPITPRADGEPDAGLARRADQRPLIGRRRAHASLDVEGGPIERRIQFDGKLARGAAALGSTRLSARPGSIVAPMRNPSRAGAA